MWVFFLIHMDGTTSTLLDLIIVEEIDGIRSMAVAFYVLNQQQNDDDEEGDEVRPVRRRIFRLYLVFWLSACFIVRYLSIFGIFSMQLFKEPSFGRCYLILVTWPWTQVRNPPGPSYQNEVA